MLELHAIPAFRDNYIWALADAGSGHCLVVDPGDAAPVERFLSERNLTLEAILITHHHPDHVAGLARLAASRQVPVYGPAHEDIAGVTSRLCEGDDVTIPAPEVHLRVMEVPGHTLGHIAYVTVGEDPPLLFCGDTLFAGGCGRLFEGTPAQMQASLDRLAGLPDATRVCCAHEYTLSNLTFALGVVPGDSAIDARWQEASSLRARDEATLPSTMEKERATNIFLRVDEPHVAAALEKHAGRRLPDRQARFAALRQWKDSA